MHCCLSDGISLPDVQLACIGLVSTQMHTWSAQASIARGLAYAPYADMLWMETSTPDLAEAQEFADAIHAKFPGKLLAYNCSPSFNWKSHLDDATIAEFQVRASPHERQLWGPAASLVCWRA